jgi:hypothetical protein
LTDPDERTDMTDRRTLDDNERSRLLANVAECEFLAVVIGARAAAERDELFAAVAEEFAELARDWVVIVAELER